MPYRDLARANEYDRNYRRARAGHVNHVRVSLEEKIIKVIRRAPLRHDILTLYKHLRKGGLPIRTIANAVRDLSAEGVLRWGATEEGEWHASRLELTKRAEEVFKPSRGRLKEKVDSPDAGRAPH